MVAITNTTSLTFLKDELDTTLGQAEAALEAFSEDQARVKDLTVCGEAFHQVRGICQMLELSAAALMAEEMELVAEDIPRSTRKTEQTAALSSAIVLLGRYLEYVQLKNQTLPELLIGGINELRRASGKPLINESHFFRVDVSRERTPPAMPNKSGRADVARLCRRLRHMYQVGLLGVLRGDSKVSLKLVGRALARIDRLCGTAPVNRLWWVARGAVEAMISDDMTLSAARKSLLSQYDRQIKRLVYEGERALDADVPLLLIKESVYVVSLCSHSDGLVGEIKRAFNVEQTLTDAVLQEEMALMSGASGSVIRSVAVALKEELRDIQSTLDLAAQGIADTNYDELSDTLLRLSGSLVMVGQAAEAELMRGRAAEVRRWRPESIDMEGEAFQSLVDDLLTVENAVATLERKYAPADDINREVRNSRISLYQLDEARMSVVAECRAGVSLTKRSLSAYIDNGGDRMHLANVPAVLGGVAGGLTFLELLRGKAIVDGCREYIDGSLLREGAQVPGREQMETLADAITSIDYYLESIEEQKPIGDAVLDVADESLAALGVTVRRPVAESA
ncbi:MAG: hypothetical protein LAT61_04455 [Alcanivorax sp.]|nr:hypothetical protein [Alcanivorax sp.]